MYQHLNKKNDSSSLLVLAFIRAFNSLAKIFFIVPTERFLHTEKLRKRTQFTNQTHQKYPLGQEYGLCFHEKACRK